MTTTATFVAFNRGDRAQYDNLRDVFKGCHAMVLSEMMSVQNILDRFRADGYGVWAGDVKQSQQCAVVWDTDLFRVSRKLCKPLLPEATRGGIHNMAKSLNAVRGNVEGFDTDIILGSIHNIQTIYTKPRQPAARAFVQGVDRFGNARKSIPTLLGGDWNGEPDDPTFEALKDWQIDQRRLNKFDTFKGRSIDWWALNDPDNQITMVKNWAKNLGNSDHKPVYLAVEETVKHTPNEAK